MQRREVGVENDASRWPRPEGAGNQARWRGPPQMDMFLIR